jgi:hypothetical protein
MVDCRGGVAMQDSLNVSCFRLDRLYAQDDSDKLGQRGNQDF